MRLISSLDDGQTIRRSHISFSTSIPNAISHSANYAVLGVLKYMMPENELILYWRLQFFRTRIEFIGKKT